MIGDQPAFSSFSVDDVGRAEAFYRDVLGVRTSTYGGMLELRLATGAGVLVYPKGDDHVPATFTVLNFPVPDVDAAVADLTARGVRFEHYPSMAEHTDEHGVVRAPEGPPIAWFTDPAGNVVAVLEGTGLDA